MTLLKPRYKSPSRLPVANWRSTARHKLGHGHRFRPTACYSAATTACGVARLAGNRGGIAGLIPIRKSAPVLSRTRAPLRWDSRHPKGRRIQLHSSARGSLRGVTSDSSYGVAEHGADGPARRSSSVGRTWWTGPPPSSFAAGCRGPRQDGQAAKTKLLPRSCLRFWTRAWGQRELADERTGRLKKPRSIAGFVQGWAGHPSHPRPFQLTSQGTPDLDV